MAFSNVAAQQSFTTCTAGIMVGFTNENFDTVECLVTLKGSDSYDFVVIDDFNFIRSYDPKTVGGLDFQTLVSFIPL